MRTVRLRALGLSVIIQDEHFYSDDGHVGNMGAYLARLHQRYGATPLGPDDFMLARRTLGVCRWFMRGGIDRPTKHVHIATVRQRSLADDLFIRGHEETHALKRFGRSSALNALVRQFGADPSILKRHDEEVLASIGGLLACLRRGVSLEQLSASLRDSPSTIRARMLLGCE